MELLESIKDLEMEFPTNLDVALEKYPTTKQVIRIRTFEFQKDTCPVNPASVKIYTKLRRTSKLRDIVKFSKISVIQQAFNSNFFSDWAWSRGKWNYIGHRRRFKHSTNPKQKCGHDIEINTFLIGETKNQNRKLTIRWNVDNLNYKNTGHSFALYWISKKKKTIT